jgi:hypothetical protein
VSFRFSAAVAAGAWRGLAGGKNPGLCGQHALLHDSPLPLPLSLLLLLLLSLLLLSLLLLLGA